MDPNSGLLDLVRTSALLAHPILACGLIYWIWWQYSWRKKNTVLKGEKRKEALEKIAEQRKEQEKLMLVEKKKEELIHKRIKAEYEKREEKMKSMIELTKLRTQKELVKSKFNPSGIEDSMETLLSSLKTNVEEVESFSSDDESIAGINSKTDLLSPLGSPAAQGISIVIEEQDEPEENDDNATDNSGNIV